MATPPTPTAVSRVGGGLRALPPDVRLDLTLTAEHRFDNGTVLLHYDVRR